MPVKFVADKFKIPEISLFESNIRALSNAATPCVTPWIVDKSFSAKTVEPIVNEFPDDIANPSNVPTDVIFGWDAVWSVPVILVALIALIPVMLPTEFKTRALLFDAVPGVTVL